MTFVLLFVIGASILFVHEQYAGNIRYDTILISNDSIFANFHNSHIKQTKLRLTKLFLKLINQKSYL